MGNRDVSTLSPRANVNRYFTCLSGGREESGALALRPGFTSQYWSPHKYGRKPATRLNDAVIGENKDGDLQPFGVAQLLC